MALYAVNDREGFRNIKKDLQYYLIKNPAIPVALVGTKSDLREDEKEDCVPFEDISKL